MKNIIRSSIISIGMAMAIFCIVGVVFDQMYGGNFTLVNYRFTKMVLGCVVIGLGFGVPSIIYRNERLPLPIKVVIHMGIGLAVYTVTAYAVGWIGAGKTFLTGFVIPFIVQVGVAFVLWLGFMRHYKNEADQINERIRDLPKHSKH